MKKQNIIIAIVLLVVGILNANSIFSFYGFPNEQKSLDTYSLGMGETGCSDLFRASTSLMNPSLAVTINNVNYATALKAGYVKYKDNYNNSFLDNTSYLPYFNIIFPLSKNHRIGFNFSSYLTANIDQKSDLMTMDDLSYYENHKLHSEIYNTEVFYAFKNKIVNIGISGKYYFGNRVEYWSQDFQDNSLFNAAYENDQTFKNPGFSVGLSKKIKNFSFGLVYVNSTKLTGDKKYTTIHNEFITVSKGFKIPREIDFGATWKMTNTTKYSLDLNYEKWEQTSDDYRNTLKISGGFAYDPLWGYGKWYQRIPLRAGAYFRQLPFDVNNNDVNEIGLTLGLSVPLKTPDKKIDIAFKFSKRGDSSYTQYEENSYFISIGFSGFDVFKRRLKKTGVRDIPIPDKSGVR